MNGKSTFIKNLITFCEEHGVPYKVVTLEDKITGAKIDTMFVDEWQEAEKHHGIGGDDGQ